MIGQRILIVEDSSGFIRPLQKALSLTPDASYTVLTCGSAEKALELLSASAFDLLISDLRLPGADGLELIAQAQKAYPKMRSMLITAFGAPQVEAQAQQLGATYLAKPFRLHDLVRAVQRILNEPVKTAIKMPTAKARPAKTSSLLTHRRWGTHLKVLACDLDGTLTYAGEVLPLTWERLRQAKIAGISLILATGRPMSSFLAEGPYTELFEAIVAEDGAVVYFPRRDSVKLPFGRLSPVIIKNLEAAGIPLEHGMSIVSTWVPHDQAALALLRDLNANVTIEYNRGCVMLLPPGATKGSGLNYALTELGYSRHNVVACGDAENDRSLFATAELAVAVADAVPAIKEVADMVLPADVGTPTSALEGLLEDLIAGRIPPHCQRPERRIMLGYVRGTTPLHVDPLVMANSALGIFGASSSGKSWLAGLLVEGLFNRDYQVCIIDPEGDYRGLASSAHSLLLGDTQTPLPAVADLVNFCEWHEVSLVLDFSTYTIEQRQEYITEFLRALRGLQARRGRPHWVLIDEIQSFCPPEGGELTDFLLEAIQDDMGCGLVSYRPSLVSSKLLQALDHWLITRLTLPEELQAISAVLPHNAADITPHLPELSTGQAYLLSSSTQTLTASFQGPTLFRVGQRSIPHIRHLHKYLRAPLPAHKRFYFCDPNGVYIGRAAANLWDFRELLGQVPIDSVQYHLGRGDFDQWLRSVLRDEELARRVQKLDRQALAGEALRQALLEVVINRYEELESLA